MLIIQVTNEKQNQRLEHPEGPIELGRGPQRDVKRFMVEDISVSRDQLRVEELAPGSIRVENLSLKIPVALADGSSVPMGGSRELNLPVRLTVGQTRIEVSPGLQDSAVEREGLLTISQPVRSRSGARPALQPLTQLGESPTPETITQWLETVIALQRSAGDPAEIYEQTARALISLVGLDIGLILLRREGKWEVVARSANDSGFAGYGREFSQTILNQVVSERRTFYQDLGSLTSQESLRNIDAVVASPIFGLQEEEVVGAVYGSRRWRGRAKGGGISTLEAQLVQLLAAAVGASLARAEATRTRVQFEQFFSPELVRELERDPDMLEGRNQEVTILMSDLRGFSRLSERLGPQAICGLVRDVMEVLSNRIAEHKGVIVSYAGDGILAMWNAPAKQENHALLACQAALAMLAELPSLDARWHDKIGVPLKLGIGINTGPVQVGNTGSSRKFVYGPLGHTVNLASRVEGATKQLGIPVLITGSTRAQLGNALITRRLCQVRVVGIAGAVELYELQGDTAPPTWMSRRDTYESALALYEGRQWSKACQTLLPLLELADNQTGFDNPTLKLMRRAWECLESPPETFDPVLELSSK
jgi:adenylate cyclase